MTTTTTFYSSVDDARIQSEDGPVGIYSIAYTGAGLYIDNASVLYVGQNYSGTYYIINEAFISFDTSSIPKGAVIHSVELRIYVNGDYSTTDFTINALPRPWIIGGVGAGDWITGGDLSSYPVVGTLNTSTISGNGYYTFSNTDLMRNYINNSSYTYTDFALVSSRHTSGTAPTGEEYITFLGGLSSGTTYDPRLTVVWDRPSGFMGISM